MKNTSGISTEEIPPAADLGISGLAPVITPNDLFYRIDTALVVPQIDPATWSLRVHGLVDDGTLLAVRNPHDSIRRVPAAFLLDGAVVDSLKGTVAVLRDSGFTDVEAITWLFTEDESLPGRPVDALRDGRKTEIRRRAQALAW